MVYSDKRLHRGGLCVVCSFRWGGFVTAELECNRPFGVTHWPRNDLILVQLFGYAGLRPTDDLRASLAQAGYESPGVAAFR